MTFVGRIDTENVDIDMMDIDMVGMHMVDMENLTDLSRTFGLVLFCAMCLENHTSHILEAIQVHNVKFENMGK